MSPPSKSPEALFNSYLRSLGLDPEPGSELAGTAQRFTKLLRERFNPLTPLPELEALPTQAGGTDDPIFIRGIAFRAFCVHHIVPFFGTIAIGYLPHEKLVGFGAFQRLVDAATRRPQLQESLVDTLANHIHSHLAPRWVLVASSARQMCMELHGSEAGTETLAIASRGELSPEDARELGLKLLG